MVSQSWQTRTPAQLQLLTALTAPVHPPEPSASSRTAQPVLPCLPAAFIPSLCRLLPAVPTSPLTTPALPPSHLNFRATRFWKLPWQVSCPLAKRLSAPKAPWTSLFPSPSTLCYNNLCTRYPSCYCGPKTTVFFNLSPQPPSRVLSWNPPDLHL